MASIAPQSSARSRGGRLVSSSVSSVAMLYTLALVALALMMRIVGDRWWVTAVLLYLPRLPLGAPLPLLAAGLALVGRKRLLWTQVLSAWVWLFPLMGLSIHLPAFGTSVNKALRVASCNVNSGYGGYDPIEREIEKESPDVVLLQEVNIGGRELGDRLQRAYRAVEVSNQFVFASRFPIEKTIDPDRLPFEGVTRSPRHLEHVVTMPFGSVVFFNAHPISPRGAFYALRGGGLRREILSGRIFSGTAAAKVLGNARLRDLQVETVSGRALQETRSVIIAGDLNLPALSPALSYLSSFQDGFQSSGFGFGYTYPVHAGFPTWMRLDRIYASSDFRFTRFRVAPNVQSDHLCVVADLERR